jgi:hypothetical protein
MPVIPALSRDPSFGNDAGVEPVRVVPACIEGRPGLLVYDSQAAALTASPAYAIVLGWSDVGQLESIRDLQR